MPNEIDTRRATYPPRGGNPEIASAVGGFTPRDMIPQDSYALPMFRNPNDPPNTNYGDPYASRRHLPRYIGFPSKYPQVLPVETPTARGIVSALIQPWLLPMPDPVRLPPAPRRGGGRVNKPADPPPKDEDKKEETTQQTTTTPAVAPRVMPRDYVGTTQIDQGATLPASVVGENATPGRFIDLQRVADVFGENVARDIKPYADRITNFFDSIGVRGSEQPDATVRGMRTDPNLTQQNPGGRTDYTWEGIGNRAAANIDAMEDLFAYNFRQGNLNPFAGQANAGMSEAATDWARNQGLNRNVYVQDLLSRRRGIDPYSAIARQQRGY